MQVAFQRAPRFMAGCDDAGARGNEFGAGGGIGDRGSDQVGEIPYERLSVWWQGVGRRRADGRHPPENVSVYTLMKLLGYESMVTSRRYVEGAGTAAAQSPLDGLIEQRR